MFRSVYSMNAVCAYVKVLGGVVPDRGVIPAGVCGLCWAWLHVIQCGLDKEAYLELVK